MLQVHGTHFAEQEPRGSASQRLVHAALTCPMPSQVSQRTQQLFNSLVQREHKTLTPLPASALHEQDCTHTPTDTRVLDTVLTVPTFPVTSLPFPGRKSIPRPLRLSLFSVLGFYTSHLCIWCWGHLEMHVPYLLTFITWHVADHTTASQHTFSTHHQQPIRKNNRKKKSHSQQQQNLENNKQTKRPF